MNYEEPEWAKAHEGEDEGAGLSELEEEDDDAKRKNEQLYCIVCSKKFKSEKQWKNHEQSKKHKEKVAELRESFTDYEEENEEEEIDGPLDSPESVEELHEKLQEELNIDNEERDVKKEVVGEADETDDEYFVAEEDMQGSSESEDEDDEMTLLKKMVSGQKNKQKNVVSKEEDEDETEVEIEGDTAEFSEFDNQKSTGRNKEAKEERNKQNAGNDMADDTSKVQIPGEGGNPDENMNATESASGALADSQKDEANSMEYDNRKSTGRRRRSKKGKDKNNQGELNEKSSEADDTQYVNRDMESQDYKKAPRSKKSTRGMKTKGTTKKNSSNECDRCGEEFESRTKLHKHLADSGHATVKSR